LALLLGNIGAVELSYGDLGKAALLHEEALVLLRDLGEQSNLARTLNNLGMALELLGDWDQAQTLMQESLQRFRELGIEQATVEPLYGLAWLAWDRRDIPRAAAFAREAVAVLNPGNAPLVSDCAELVAALAAHQGEHRRGARLLGGATALREANGIELTPKDRAFHDRATREVQAGLSPEVMAEQFAAGQDLTAEETAAEAAALAAELAAAGSAQPDVLAEASVLAR
jgi:tetratricopeptide (TPR) repeat protein